MQSYAGLENSDSDKISQFRQLSEAFCGTLGGHDIPFRPYVSPELPHFSKLPQDLQAIVLASLEESLAVWKEAEADGEPLADSSRLVWRALSRMRLVPQPDIIDKITDDSVVEIYTSEFRQIFRNLNFFRFFSCTLEELVSMPGYELARIPEEALRYLAATARRLGEGGIQETYVPEIAPYVFEEAVGVRRLKVEVTLSYCSPILDKGKSIALIVVNKSRIVGTA